MIVAESEMADMGSSRVMTIWYLTRRSPHWNGMCRLFRSDMWWRFSSAGPLRTAVDSFAELSRRQKPSPSW